MVSKSKITNLLNPRKIQNGMSLIKRQNQKLIQIKRIENDCLISDLLQIFPFEENDGLSLMSLLVKTLNCIKFNSFIYLYNNSV